MITHFVDDYAFLSNYYEAPVSFHGLTYRNAEAAFQAQKCVNIADCQTFTLLSASEAKHLGRKVHLRKDWESVKVSLMKQIVKAKFDQNVDLRTKLLDTEGEYLEEGNDWGDTIWGTVNGRGQNLLGQILMDIRDEYLREFDYEQDS